MVYKIILYLIFGFVLLILVGSKVTAENTMPPQAPKLSKVDSLFERIGKCESGNNPRAKNRTSSASGRFQFIYSSWYHYGLELWGDEFYEKSVWSYKDNTELAWYVYQKNGTSDWLESKKCWSRPNVDV